jgi:hypothetical protein
VLGAVENEVSALAQGYRRAPARILEAPDLVDSGARGVHDGAGRHGGGAALHVVAHCGSDAAVRAFERDHFDPACDRRTCVSGGADVGQAEPRVVSLSVLVQAHGTQAADVERRDELGGLVGRDREAAQARCAGQPRVGRERRPDRSRPVRAVALDREQERQLVDEVRRHLTSEHALLVERLADQPEVAHPQVAKTAVDEL